MRIFNDPRTIFVWSCGITVVGAMIAYWLLGGVPFIGLDDANITLVYARNIAQGYGYTYTPGYECVEGSTSLLWTLLISLLFMAKLPGPEIYVILLSGMFCALSVYFSFFVFFQLSDGLGFSRRRAGLLYSLFLINLSAFYAWNVFTMMDVCLWTCLLIGAVCVFLRFIENLMTVRKFIVLSCMVSLLLVVTRPEAMLLVPVLFVLCALVQIGVRSPQKIVLSTFPGLLTYLITVVCLTIWRLKYFGVLLPNTYYAKVSSEPIDNIVHGSRYLARYFFEETGRGIFIIGLVIFLVLFTRSSYRHALKNVAHSPALGRMLIFLSFFLLTMLTVVVATGGDHFVAFRLYQPISTLLFLPLFILIGQLKWERLKITFFPARLLTIIITLLVLVYFAAQCYHFSAEKRFKNGFFVAQRGRNVGRILNQLSSDDSELSIGAIAAGGIAYNFRGRVYDLLGLNWSEMAHARGKREGIKGHDSFKASVLLDTMPQLVTPRIVRNSGAFAEHRFVSRVLRGLLTTPVFQEVYLPIFIHLNQQRVFAYGLKSWIRQVKRDSADRVEVIAWDKLYIGNFGYR